MLRRISVFFGLLICITVLAAPTYAIKRVSPKYQFLEVYGGPTFPVGDYTNIVGLGITDVYGRRLTISGDEAYNPGFTLGVTYGQLLHKHLVASVGFRYTKVNLDDRITVGWPDRPTINVYDIQFNGNWMMLDLNESFWSPYVGIGVDLGLAGRNEVYFQDQYEAVLDATLNFGADVKVWHASVGDSFLALSSINTLSLSGTAERPRNFNLGFGLRYYFK